MAAGRWPAGYGRSPFRAESRDAAHRVSSPRSPNGLEQKSSQIQATLHDKLPAVMAARAAVTARAVTADHEPRRAKFRGHPEPRPDESKIRTAASLQARDLVEIVLD